MGLTTCFYFIHSLPWRLFIVNNKNCENKNFLWNNTCSFAKNVVGYIYLYRKCPATGERCIVWRRRKVGLLLAWRRI